jgi:hypothetical protein
VIRGSSREGEGEGEAGGRGRVVEAIEREFGAVVQVSCSCFGRDAMSRYPLARTKECLEISLSERRNQKAEKYYETKMKSVDLPTY